MTLGFLSTFAFPARFAAARKLGAAFAVAFLSVALLPGCDGGSLLQSDTDLVKNGVMEFNKTLTVGQAFDNWANCQSRKWSEFKAPNGVRVVQFDCEVAGVADFMQKVRAIDMQDRDSATKDTRHLEVTGQTQTFQWTINQDGSSFQISYVGLKWVWKDGKTLEDKGDVSKFLASVYANEKVFDPSKLTADAMVWPFAIMMRQLHNAAQGGLNDESTRPQSAVDDAKSQSNASGAGETGRQVDSDDTKLVRNGVLEGQTRTIGDAFDGWTDCQSKKWSGFKSKSSNMREVLFECEVASIADYMRQVRYLMDKGGLSGEYANLDEYIANPLEVTSVICSFRWTADYEGHSFRLDSVEYTWFWGDDEGDPFRQYSEKNLSKIVAVVYGNKKLFDPSTLVDLAAANNFVKSVLIPIWNIPGS